MEQSLTNEVEGNKLIAKFMGRERGYESTYEIFYANLQYHSSWDWLMPVCYKWDNVFEECLVDSDISKEYEGLCDLLDEAVTLYKILPVFKQLVENIKWYNNQVNIAKK